MLLQGDEKKNVHLPARGKTTVFDVVWENMESWGQVRRFLKRDVGNNYVNRVIAAATSAHSTDGRQPWEFVVVRDADLRCRLAETTEAHDWMACAPVLIIICANDKLAGAGRNMDRGTKLYAVQDVAAAAQNLVLAANALGLAAGWVSAFDESKVTGIIRSPVWIRPQVIIALGWPAEPPERKFRHDLKDILHEDTFGETPRAHEAWGHGH